jgi:nitroimidazol reductase NimA-like FMN-containing flavoprotein (pyridoxamine 5'-phosphate oxidase superfamily)
MRYDERTEMMVLDDDDSWRLLESAEVVRIAVAVPGDVEIFPVNTVVDEHTLVFRTAEGTKLAALAMSGRVTVEADGQTPGGQEAWSVVVKGDAELLESFPEIYRAEELPLRCSHPGHKGRWVRVRPRDIQGRQFTQGDTRHAAG